MFYLGFKGDLNGKFLKSGQTAFNYNMQHSFTINKTLSLESTLEYQSPLQYGIFKVQSQTSLNFGLKKTFMNNKANLKLSMDDIFNTQKERVSTTFENMD